jgi:hypothetical protein
VSQIAKDEPFQLLSFYHIDIHVLCNGLDPLKFYVGENREEVWRGEQNKNKQKKIKKK